MRKPRGRKQPLTAIEKEIRRIERRMAASVKERQRYEPLLARIDKKGNDILHSPDSGILI